jgi:hypothetical protein
MRNASTLVWIVVVPLLMLSLGLLQALSPSGGSMQASNPDAMQGASLGSEVSL